MYIVLKANNGVLDIIATHILDNLEWRIMMLAESCALQYAMQVRVLRLGTTECEKCQYLQSASLKRKALIGLCKIGSTYLTLFM